MTFFLYSKPAPVPLVFNNKFNERYLTKQKQIKI